MFLHQLRIGGLRMKTRKLLLLWIYRVIFILAIIILSSFIGSNTILVAYADETITGAIEETYKETNTEEISGQDDQDLEEGSVAEEGEEIEETESGNETERIQEDGHTQEENAKNATTQDEIENIDITLEECIKELVKIFTPTEENEIVDDYIIFGENQGYLKGIPNRKKDQVLTRGNLARIMCNVLNIQPIYSKDPLFSDIKGQLNEEYIKAAYAEYLFDGINQGEFGYNHAVKTEHFEIILDRIKSYKANPQAFKGKMKAVSGTNKAEKIKKLLSMTTYKSAAKKIDSGTYMGILKKNQSKVFINGYQIPSFIYNDSTVIFLSDLKQYGFNLDWNDALKAICIQRAKDQAITGLSTEEIKKREESLVNHKVVYTNTSVYIGNRKIPCYSVNNSSLIYVNDLSLFGSVEWNGKEVKLTLNNDMTNDGLNVKLLGNKVYNCNNASIDVEIVHLWYDEKSRSFSTDEDIFYSIPKNGSETIHLEKYASYEKKAYIGTIIKKTSLSVNPLYEKDINYYKSQRVIDYVCGISKDSDENLFSLVKPSIIIGTMKRSVGGFTKGEKVEILYGEDGSWYQCKSMSTGKTGRIPWGSVSIPPDPPTNKNRMTKEQLETYVNKKGFTSQTNYFVWTDLDRQITHVFQKENGRWKLLRSMLCSTGRNITPTPRGFFTIKERGAYFGKGYMCKNWVQIWGDYLYHSVLMDVTGTYVLENNVLGKRASHGCIRFSVEDSKWFYDTIPRNTTVWIN